MMLIASLTASPHHRFWAADFPFAAPMLRGKRGIVVASRFVFRDLVAIRT